MIRTRSEKSILHGNPMPTLLTFAVPIICGNVFQQLYNIVDAMVVGAYLGDLPLGGISAAAPIMDVLYGIVTGGTVGVSALLAQLYGAGKKDRLKRVHVTALTAGTVFIVMLGLIALAASPAILNAQKTNPRIIEESMRYLTIICLGMMLNFFYSYFAAALRACGNSTTPFLVLLFSSVLHAGLDVLLVGVFRLEIIGVAVSTVFCQLLSAVVLFLYCQKKSPELSLERSQRFDRKELGAVAGFAWAGALQQIVVQVGRLLIQGMLSGMPVGEIPEGADPELYLSHRVTGYNMGMRVEVFLVGIFQGVSGASVVTMSQNFGYGSGKQVVAFYKRGLLLAVIYGAVLFCVCHGFSRELIGMFTDNEDVIRSGSSYVSLMGNFYILACFGEMTQALYRGIGKLKICALASGLQVLLRVILSYLLIPRLGIPGISYSVATGWFLLVLVEGAFTVMECKKLLKLQKN